MTSKVTLNPEQKLYVIPCSAGGYSCWGFDNCFNEATALAQRVGKPVPAPEDHGTMKVYEYHGELIKQVRLNKIELGTWFDPKTPKEVQDVIEAMRLSGLRVRIYCGDTVTGKSWLEEYDTVGRVGRSGGTLKIPLLVPDGEDGGGGILTASVIRIQVASSKHDLYRHPLFHVGVMELMPMTVGDNPWVVKVDGVFTAYFKTETKAQNWIDYMNGERMKP